jgi:hypothetical protein
MSADVMLGQVTAVELKFVSEVFMLGVDTKTKYTIDRQYESEYMALSSLAITSWRYRRWNPFNRAPVDSR